MWWVFAVPLVLFFGWRWKVAGPQLAVGETILWSLLVPTWVVLPVGNLPLDLRSGIASLGLIAYCLHKDAQFRTRLSLADVAVLAIFATHLFSDSLNDGFGLGIFCRAYGEWIIPYLAGRVSVRGVDDVRKLRKTACAVAVLLAGWAATESISGVNPANALVGRRPVDRTPLHAVRWDLKRAEGPTIHPIWFGMVQTLLLPWTLSAAVASVRGVVPRYLVVVPVIGACGVFFSLSRGPWLAYLLILYGTAICRVPSRRLPLLGIGVAILIGSTFAQRQVLVGLQWLTTNTTAQKTLLVDDQQITHNETTHRILLLHVYGEAMRRAGLLGFGTERTATFPVRVPMGTLDPTTMKAFWTIDNEYILFQLRFGAIGVTGLVVLLAASAIAAIRYGCIPQAPAGLFMAALGSTAAACLVVLMVEWMPFDYGFPLLWSLGAATGFQAWKSGGSRKWIAANP